MTTPTPAGKRPSLLPLVFILVLVGVGFWYVSRPSSSGADALPFQPPVSTLEDKMLVVVTTCTDDGAKGTVHNTSNQTVDIYVQTHYLDSAGVVLDDGIDNVAGLRPGETADWDAGYFGGKDVARCRAEVGSVFAK